MNEKRLDFYVEHNQNVLFTGLHGVGKTAIVKEVFERHGLRWMYFSASTMDPWVDFIGVPRVEKDESGQSYLNLVRPLTFAKDEIDAIFFDELNRSCDKIRNAVLELIQFKSINGHKFHNLRMIWAAINPEDDEENVFDYDVEKLDPAQKDRFQIQIEIPYKPNLNYFQNKFGENGSRAVSWWNTLDKDTTKLISPRRLDYALEIYKLGGDLRDVLPLKANITSLKSVLKNGSYESRIQQAFDEKNVKQAEEFMKNIDMLNGSIDFIMNRDEYADFFFPFIPKENLASFLDRGKIWEIMSRNHNAYLEFMKNTAIGTKNRKLKNRINKWIGDKQSYGLFFISPPKMYKGAQLENLDICEVKKSFNMDQTYERIKSYDYVVKCFLSPSISVKDAREAINFIQMILQRTQKNTLDSKIGRDNIKGHLRHLTNVLMKEKGQSESDIIKSTPMLKKCLDRLSSFGWV